MSDFVMCPNCDKRVRSILINTHLDTNCTKFNSDSRKKPKFNTDQPLLNFSQFPESMNIDIESHNNNLFQYKSDNSNDTISIVGTNDGNKVNDNEYNDININNTINSSNNSISQIKDLLSPSATNRNYSFIKTQNNNNTNIINHERPLSDKLRPSSIDEFYGNEEIFGENSFVRKFILTDKLPSLILWGPPGCGKTTIAHIISKTTKKLFLQLSAVDSGVKDIQKYIEKAGNHYRLTGNGSILFIDEIHRYNTKQQDLFLPYIENGTFILIGATTENPSFSLNNELLSMCTVEKLIPLNNEAINKIIDKAINTTNLKITEEAHKYLCSISNGDARKVINSIEQISNIKSQLGSDIQAASYYLAYMIEGGEDPLYIARRILVFASEDVGLADSLALEQAELALEVVKSLGLPECKLALLQATIYCCMAPKSNEFDDSYGKLREFVNKSEQYELPSHVRNITFNLNKELESDAEYKYPPDYNYEDNQKYLPLEIRSNKFIDVNKLKGFGRFKPK